MPELQDGLRCDAGRHRLRLLQTPATGDPGRERRRAGRRRSRVPMVKITGGQRIDLLGISKEALPEVWQDLGMPSGHAYTKAFRTCKTCVGTEFCRYGVGDSTRLGIEIEQRFQGIESPHKMK